MDEDLHLYCVDCRKMDRRSEPPEKCKSEEAIKNYQNLHSNTKDIPSCLEINQHHNCEFHQFTLEGFFERIIWGR